MRIYLVGYMGSGKSGVVKRLSHRLGWEYYDTDVMFECKFHMSVDNFFQRFDEKLFRDLETQVLHSTEEFDNVVIATGGGTACYNNNMEWMNEHGVTVFLKVSPKTSIDRLLHSKKKRPLTKGKTEEELIEYVTKHYASRMPFYEQAKYTIKGEDFDVEELMELLKEEFSV